MSTGSPRQASAPPRIPGFDYVRVLGAGGSADVYLYRQHLPSRLVAVKVLAAQGLDDEVRRRFTDEANLMAQLSHHPSIVTVHHASVAADGRPYLVMEHCSQPGLGERYRVERMGVAEVLRIGVRLASAVQTAHGHGVLHRDIKPANVLTTDFGWPALTDFGIAATVGQQGAAGLSVPWAPPEMLATPPSSDERSDVYCLGATLYSALAGRSPFEVPGGANGAADLVMRIERDPLPAVGRADVPAGLSRVLARAMAKRPADRYASALELGRALQRVESELALPVTTLDLPGEGAPRAGTLAGSAGDATRPRPPLVVPPASAGPADARSPADGRSADSPAPGPRRAGAGQVAAAAVVVVAVAGLVVAWLHGATPAPADPDGFGEATAPPAAAVPAVRDLAGARGPDGSVRFTWTNPAPEDGDTYRWGVVTATGEDALAAAGGPTATVRDAPGAVCVQVLLVRADGRVSAQPARGCAG